MSLNESWENDTLSAQCDAAHLLAERDELIRTLRAMTNAIAVTLEDGLNHNTREWLVNLVCKANQLTDNKVQG